MRRRTVLRAGLGLAAAGLTGCSPGEYRGPQRVVTLAAGEPGGFYVEFARLLAAELNAAEPVLRCEVHETRGSVENLELVMSGRADLGLSLVDVATSTVARRLRTLGRVYENYMQLVGRRDSPVRALADLAGRTVSLGATGSGAAVFGARLVAAAGLDVRADHRPLSDAVDALERGMIDALLWSGGVPTPALADLDRRTGIRLLDLAGQVPALRAAHGRVYEPVWLPAGSYRAETAVPTIGVPNLLVCNESLPDDLAAAVVRVLVGRAARLVPQQALGTQYLDVRSLITTGTVALHPGAARAYRDLRG